MARSGGEEEGRDRDAVIRRQVGRTLVNWILFGASLAVIGGWVSMGFYQLEPGEAAVILRLGRFDRSVEEPGFKWHLPPPIEIEKKVNLSEIRIEEFGAGGGDSGGVVDEAGATESAIQTADNNIVNLSYNVQYRIRSARSFVYGMARPSETLRDAAQAAVREVVGRKSVDAVLSSERGAVQREARTILQRMLDSYFDGDASRSAFEVISVELQLVQPPGPVQEAFADVIAAQQDEVRATSEARGDASEIVERADAEATELREAARAYRDSKILEASGEATRFTALQEQYARAPEVTRQRLYLEAMEEVLPGVQKLIVEPNIVNLFPSLPLAPSVSTAGQAPRPGGQP